MRRLIHWPSLRRFKSYVTFSSAGVKVDLKSYLASTEGRQAVLGVQRSIQVSTLTRLSAETDTE